MSDEQSLVNNLGRLERRISELEAHEEVVFTFMAKTVTEIAELREKMKIYKGFIGGNSDKLNELKEVAGMKKKQVERIDNLEEVLREYMNYMKNFNPQSWVGINKILTKLASEGEKPREDETKIWKFCKDCPYEYDGYQLGTEFEPNTHIVVKREDLERLFFVLDWELNMDTLTHKDYKYINKFKEEYNL